MSIQLNNSPLGKEVKYHADKPDKDILVAIPRNLKRQEMKIPTPLPFKGVDIWNAYEVSWLRPSGRPDVAIATFYVPADSPNLIESKSFKLYLNSFNQYKISTNDLLTTLHNDLSECAGKEIRIDLCHPSQFYEQKFKAIDAQQLDDLDPAESYVYQPDAKLLKILDQHPKQESWQSCLLKSNCLITGQPDWADILIRYEGPQICPEGLLKYIISFRTQNEFHEPCVERIFQDIMNQCRPDKLTVYARYTRRGGLDISPFRSNYESLESFQRTPRQ